MDKNKDTKMFLEGDEGQLACDLLSAFREVFGEDIDEVAITTIRSVDGQMPLKFTGYASTNSNPTVRRNLEAVQSSYRSDLSAKLRSSLISTHQNLEATMQCIDYDENAPGVAWDGHWFLWRESLTETVFMFYNAQGTTVSNAWLNGVNNGSIDPMHNVKELIKIVGPMISAIIQKRIKQKSGGIISDLG